MANSAGTPGSSSGETSPAPASTGLLPELNTSTQSPPPQGSSPPSGGGGGGQSQSPPSPPTSPDNGSSNSTSTPPSPPPPSKSESSPPPSPPSPSKNSPPPSPPSDTPPPKASPPPSSSPSPPPPSSSSPSPPSPPPPNQPTPVSSSPPPPSNNNAPTPPSNENTTPPPSEGSKSPPPPPQESTTPPSPLFPPVPSSQSPNSSPSIVITPAGPQSESPPPHRGTPSLGPPSNTKSEANSPSSSSSNNTAEKTVVGVAVAGAFLIALIAIFFVACKRRKRRRVDVYAPHYMPPNSFSVKSDGYYYAQQQSMGHSGPVDPYQQSSHSHLVNSYGSQRGQMYSGGPDTSGIGGGKTFFSYDELMELTGGFSRQNILGEGGFGCVYKGWLPDGKVVAVKQLKAGSGQGEREFRAEVEIISRVHHRHLVSLVGYCISESQRLLIYEFVPNKTLEQHLFEGSAVLDWPKRVKIAIGSAKGLAYLHEDCHPKIIHRDIKSANILLDDDFEAQVADFGLARLNDSPQTHVSTRVMGTFGYMAPEYASSGKLTDRSDVFSFGVVLLELITGRKPVDPSQPLGDESLVEWARPLLVQALETGDISELVDPRLQKHYVESEVFRMIEAAAACVRHSAPKRPRMVQVVRALDSEGEMADLSNGVKYGQSTVYDSGQYNQDIMKFRRMALGSDCSSEYDMQSGDYTSKEVPRRFPNSWKSSGEFTSGESETRAMNGHSSAQGNSVAPRF